MGYLCIMCLVRSIEYDKYQVKPLQNIQGEVCLVEDGIISIEVSPGGVSCGNDCGAAVELYLGDPGFCHYLDLLFQDIDQTIDIFFVPELINLIQPHDSLICMAEQAGLDEPFPVFLDGTVGQAPGG